MFGSRRKFLGGIGLGIVGAGLILPDEAHAFFRRRRVGCQEGTRSEDLSPVFPSVFVKNASPAVSIQTANGYFSSWGIDDDAITDIAIILTATKDQSDMTDIGNSTSVAEGNADHYWAFKFSGLGDGTQFYFRLAYKKNGVSVTPDYRGPYVAKNV